MPSPNDGAEPARITGILNPKTKEMKMKESDTTTPMELELFLLIQEMKKMISNQHWLKKVDERLEVIKESCTND